jgi:hypothetical protein
MKVYLTRRNIDMTAGCGPMVNDACFSTRRLAEEYIDFKPGIMGRKLKWSEGQYGDWDIEELEIDEFIKHKLMYDRIKKSI